MINIELTKTSQEKFTCKKCHGTNCKIIEENILDEENKIIGKDLFIKCNDCCEQEANMVCKLDNGKVITINKISDLRDYIDEDLYKFIEEADIYSLKECIQEIKESLNFLKENINNSKRLNKVKLIKDINNMLTEINYYNNQKEVIYYKTIKRLY